MLVVALACALAGCSAASDDAAPRHDAGADAGSTAGFDAAVADPTRYEFPCLEPWEPTGASNYAAIFRELLCTHGCTAPYCHGSRTASAGLSFETLAVGYAGLRASAPDPLSLCSDAQRVVPGAPEESLLYLKLLGQAPCGTAMPPPDSGWPAFSEAELQRVAEWIAAGAADD